MSIPVDVTSPFGTFSPSFVCRRCDEWRNGILETSWMGRRLLGRLRRPMERLCWSRARSIVDDVRFGLRWRLYRSGNWADSRLLLHPDAFDPTEIRSIIDLVEPGFTFVDVGANCGFYSLRIADVLAGTTTGRVIAIEPHPEMRRRLAFNARINPACRVHIVGCALGDRTGKARLLESESNLGRTRVSDRGSIEVEIRTLLDIVAAEDLERIDAIKIDVEGFEDRILDPFFRDAPEFLLPRIVVAELSLRDDWLTDWLSRAATRGYVEHTRTQHGNVILVRP